MHECAPRSLSSPSRRVTRSLAPPSLLLLVATAVIAGAGSVSAQSLRGSPASLDRQNVEARRHDFTFLRREAQLERFVDAGLLVPVTGGTHYRLHDVSFEVARPEVRLFIERLSAQYERACGEPVVVTSLTRPIALQPDNASARSVHPTGMAVDLRRPTNRACLRWLESTLLSLERARVLEATLEHNPPHFHVAVFPSEYVSYVARITRQPVRVVEAKLAGPREHTVRAGETLWAIANEYDTTVAQVRRANGLNSNTIRPGQVLEIPGGATGVQTAMASR